MTKNATYHELYETGRQCEKAIFDYHWGDNLTWRRPIVVQVSFGSKTIQIVDIATGGQF